MFNQKNMDKCSSSSFFISVVKRLVYFQPEYLQVDTYQHHIYHLGIMLLQSHKTIIVVQVVIRTSIHGGHYHDDFDNYKYVSSMSHKNRGIEYTHAISTWYYQPKCSHHSGFVNTKRALVWYSNFTCNRNS